MLELNKIYNMDCIEGMKQIPDNSIDSIVTDPPYELGFMGKSWDNSGIANSVEMWKEAYRVLKPGGYLLSFGGTRTYHRMACAIEAAGFEIRDMIEWVYGSGFPKSLNIGKAVDKLQGNKREHLGLNPNARDGGGNVQIIQKRKDDILTKGTSEWEGWGTALKPAHEPIVVARKPIAEKSVAENVLKYGTGGINIDESRVEHNEELKVGFMKTNREKGLNSTSYGGEKDNRTEDWTSTQGRFPANVIHDGSPEVLKEFEKAGVSISSGGRIGNKGSMLNMCGNIYEKGNPGKGDTGTPARFFKSCEFGIEDAPSFIYTAKASKSERNEGCEEFNEKNINDGRLTSIDNPFQRGDTLRKNIHPTVKPLKLMEYLVKLVTPKDGVCLDPFMGSGTTAVACKKNGFKYLGFEKEAEYIEICEARLKNKKGQERLF